MEFTLGFGSQVKKKKWSGIDVVSLHAKSQQVHFQEKTPPNLVRETNLQAHVQSQGYR